jgi:hypothetical protein
MVGRRDSVGVVGWMGDHRWFPEEPGLYQRGGFFRHNSASIPMGGLFPDHAADFRPSRFPSSPNVAFRLVFIFISISCSVPVSVPSSGRCFAPSGRICLRQAGISCVRPPLFCLRGPSDPFVFDCVVASSLPSSPSPCRQNIGPTHPPYTRETPADHRGGGERGGTYGTRTCLEGGGG